jgi:hypothetical protein
VKKPARAGKARGLSFDFNAAARRAHRDHPELRHTLFINAANDDWPDVAGFLLEQDVPEEDIDTLHATFREARKLRTSFHQVVDGGGHPLGAVVFHPDRHPLYGPERGIVDDAGSFDHETGHALSPDATETPGENLADAYAALRHLQRFGGKAEDIDYCAWKRAMIFMETGSTSHLTTFTIDKIIVDRKSADFMSLTPQETAAIARSYAKKNTPGDKRLRRLRKDFRPLRGLPPKEALRKLARITLKADPESDTFYLGARILSGALRDEGAVIDGREINLKGPAWDDLREKLDARIGELPARHPLRHLHRPRK